MFARCRRPAILLGTALVALAPLPAHAQDNAKPAYSPMPGYPVLTDPAAVAACLCSRQQLPVLRSQMEQARQRYADAKARDAALRGQVAAAHIRDTPAEAASVDAYRRLLQESERARVGLNGTAIPDLRAAANRYNAGVASFNAACAGKAIEPKVQATVSTTLSCAIPGDGAGEP